MAPEPFNCAEKKITRQTTDKYENVFDHMFLWLHKKYHIFRKKQTKYYAFLAVL